MNVIKFGWFLSSRYVFNTIILVDSESEESSEDEDIEAALLVHTSHRKNTVPLKRKCFIEIIVAGFSEQEFQSHFRMSRTSYEVLLAKLKPQLDKLEGSVGKNRISAEKQILSALWLLATPDSFRSVGLQFDMAKSSLFVSFERFIQALNIIAPSVISWPTRQERQAIKAGFRRLAAMEGVVGAIDGSFVKIKAPRDNPEVYINRKCFHGITLQAICTNTLKFTDCFAGYPSSVSDVRIFRNSNIYKAIMTNTDHYFDYGEYIIGDKAYAVFPWCIPPYIDRGRLLNVNRQFNSVHARTRQVIERSFALLFGRFRRLRDLDMNRIDLIPQTIIACCVLHNICLSLADELVDMYIAEGALHILNNDNDEEVLQINERALRNLGNIRRDQLLAQLAR